MAEGIRFPDDMVGKITTFNDDDKVLISDSQDGKKAKWWSFAYVKSWLTGFFAQKNAENITSTSLTAWQSTLKIALLSNSIGSAVGVSITTLGTNGYFATDATTTDLPSTNLVGIVKVAINGATKYLTYQTYQSAKVETWLNFYDGATWGGWAKIVSDVAAYPALLANTIVDLSTFNLTFYGVGAFLVDVTSGTITLKNRTTAANASQITLSDSALAISLGAGLSLAVDVTNGYKVTDTLLGRGLGDAADYSSTKQDYDYATKKMLADQIGVALTSVIKDRGNFDASVNLFPSSGGSGTAGAILKGDIWYISVAGTLGSQDVNIGDTVRALADAPGQTESNWAIIEGNLGYVPENQANKENTTLDTSIVKYPTNRLVKEYADSLVAAPQDLDNVMKVGSSASIATVISMITSAVSVIARTTNANGYVALQKLVSGAYTGFFAGNGVDTRDVIMGIATNESMSDGFSGFKYDSQVHALFMVLSNSEKIIWYGDRLIFENIYNAGFQIQSSVTTFLVEDGRAIPKGLGDYADYSANKTNYSYATKKMLDNRIYSPVTQPAIVAGTPDTLTFDCASKLEAKFEPRLSVGTLTISSDFTVVFSNVTGTFLISAVFRLTGTRIIPFPSNVRCSNPSSIGDWTGTTLTLSTGTDDIIEMQLEWYASGAVWLLKVAEVAV